MNTAVIKFNALADAVGTAAQDNHFFSVRHPGFAFAFIGGVIVRGDRPEFCGTGIHQFIYRNNAKVFSFPFDLLVCQSTGQIGQLHVGEPIFFRLFKQILRQVHAGQFQLFFKVNDLLHLIQKPWINGSQLMDHGDGHAVFNGIFDIKNALGIGGG